VHWSRRRSTLLVALATSAICLAALTGCGAGQTEVEARSTGTQSPSSTPSDDLADRIKDGEEGLATPPPTDTADPGVGKIGQDAFTYTDGLEVRVLKAERFRFSTYSTAGAKPGVAVTVKITNTTGDRVDLSLAQVVLRYGPDEQEAEQVFDSENGFEGGFQTSVASGKSASAKYGFEVPKGRQSITVEVAPAWDYEPSTFEGSVR
jgi:hypothetical protein